jgi:hypothetical protein
VKRSGHVTVMVEWWKGAGLHAQAAETSLNLRQHEETM